MVIQVNQRLVETEIASVYLNFINTDGKISKKLVSYHPGELILEPEDWKKINSDGTERIILSFDYYGHSQKLSSILNVEVEMLKNYFAMPYLIVRIYDFRERKFKKRYGCLTDKNFIAEVNLPQGGVLIRCN